MNLATARRVMDASLSATPPPYGDWVIAGKVIYQHYRDHPGELKPTAPRGTYTTDAVRPRSTRASIQKNLNLLRAEMRDLERLVASKMEEWEGAQTGRKPTSDLPDLMEASPSKRMAGSRQGDPGVTGIPARAPLGDVVARYKRTRIARDAGRDFASEFNTRMRQHWGQVGV